MPLRDTAVMPSPTLWCVPLLALVACGSSDVARDCERAVARYRAADPSVEAALAKALSEPDQLGRHAYLKSVVERRRRQNARLAVVLQQRCREDRWSAKMRRCIANDDPGCPDLLPRDQYAKFDADFSAANADFVAEKKADRNPWNPDMNAQCGDVVQAADRVVGAALSGDARNHLHLEVLRTCTRWHFTAVNCYGNAATAAAMKDCEPYLTPDQRTAMAEALAPTPE